MIENLIEKLAYESHMDKSTSLEVHLQPQQKEILLDADIKGIEVSKNTITFDSIEIRNIHTANYIYKKERNCITEPVEWISIAVDVWQKEIRNRFNSSDKAAGHLLAKIHESNDMFLLMHRVIRDTKKGRNTYQYASVLTSAIPHFNNISAENIIKLFCSEDIPHQNASSLNSVISEIQNSLGKFPKICLEIHKKLIIYKLGNISSLYTTTILALAKTDLGNALKFVLLDAESTNKELKKSALWTLKCLYEDKLLSENEALTAANLLLLNSIDETREISINAMTSLLTITDKFDERLIELGKNDQYTLEKIAFILSINHEKIEPKERVLKLISLLNGISIDNQVGVNYFHEALTSLLTNEQYTENVIDVFSSWIIYQTNEKAYKAKEEINQFQYLFYEIANKPLLLSKIITKWFLSGERQLAIASSEFLSILWISRFKIPKFNKIILDDLDSQDLQFLARLMLGYIYDQDHLISLSMSFLETENAPTRVFGLVRSILVDEVGIDYPSAVIERCKLQIELSNDKEWIIFYEEIIQEIETPLKEFKKLNVINEFKPSFDLQRKLSIARNKSMNNSIGKARKESFISSIVNEIPIKAGKGFFSFRDGEFTEPSFMHPRSISIPVSRRDETDELGSKIRRFHYKNSKRGMK